MPPEFDVERLYAATTPAELTAEYDRVAESYDAALVDEHAWRLPEVVAGVAGWLLPRSARILDAACGTGLVGVGLARFGFRAVHGLDLVEHCGPTPSLTCGGLSPVPMRTFLSLLGIDAIIGPSWMQRVKIWLNPIEHTIALST